MWRPATRDDDEEITAMCMSLNAEDPGASPVPPSNVHRTLDFFRREPSRGRAVVLEVDGAVAGYALLVPFWSNEQGGEICEVDEVFVKADRRGRGLGASLFEAIERGAIWPLPIVGTALGVTDHNRRARRLYERVGFSKAGTVMFKPSTPR